MIDTQQLDELYLVAKLSVNIQSTQFANNLNNYDIQITNPTVQFHSTIVQKIIFLLSQIKYQQKRFKTTLTKQQKYQLQYINRSLAKIKINLSDSTTNKVCIDIHDIKFQHYSNYDIITQYSAKLFKIDIDQAQEYSLTQKTIDLTKFEIDTQLMSLETLRQIKDAQNIYSLQPTNNKLILDINTKIDLNLLNSRQIGTKILIKQIEFVGNEFLPHQVYLITQSVKQYIGDTYIPTQHYNTQNTLVLEDIKEEISFDESTMIDIFEKQDTSMLLYINICRSSFQLNFSTEQNLNENNIQFSLPNIVIAGKIVWSQIQLDGKDIYQSQHIQQFFNQYMKKNNLKILRVDCQQNMEIQSVVNIYGQDINFPQEIFEFTMLCLQQFQIEELATIRQHQQEISADSSQNADEFELQMLEFQNELNQLIIPTKTINILTHIDRLTVFFHSSPLKSRYDQDKHFSTLVGDITNFKLNFIQYSNQQQFAQITCSNIRGYIIPNIMIQQIKVYEQNIQKFPSFAIPLMVQLENLFVNIMGQQQSSNIVEISVIQQSIGAQLSAQSFEQFAIIFSVWKENINNIIVQTKELFTFRKKIKTLQLQKAKTIINEAAISKQHTKFNIACQSINFNWYPTEYYVVPSVILQLQNRQQNKVDMNDQMLIQLLQMQQNQKKYLPIIQCTNQANENLIISYQSTQDIDNIQIVLPKYIIQMDVASKIVLDFDSIVILYQIDKCLHKLQFSIILNEMNLKNFSDIELADINVSQLYITCSYINKFKFNFNLKSARIHFGCTLLQSITKSIQLLLYQSTQNWQRGVQITQQLGSVQIKNENSIVIAPTQVKQYIDELLKSQSEINTKPICQSLVNSSAINAAKPKWIQFTSRFVKYFQETIHNEIQISIQQFDVLLSQFSLADNNMLRLQAAGLQLNQYQQQTKSTVSKLPNKVMSAMINLENQQISGTISQRSGFSVRQMSLDLIMRNQKYNPDSGYSLNGQKIQYSKDFVNDQKAFTKINAIVTSNSSWQIQSTIILELLQQSFFELNLDVDADTHPGVFQTGEALMKVIDMLNLIIRDLITFITSVMKQQSSEDIQKNFQRKMQQKQLQEQLVNGLKVLNADELDELQVLLRLKTKNMNKLLPNIDILGQGTGVIESFARNFSSTTKIIEEMVQSIDVAFLNLAHIIFKTLKTLFGK
ncbi:Conserved_hypothetical protein [Hexamita inflata]|uniref:Uncharacterized protein n=1 Tax=Hexamita inflata TaxID=28002 RepID=A0AA86QIB2_9EUKA|nr:Conserved hypothetical protein [Hexamita inflata]CAI9965869.1 Conserved hypothetical protein [Hexamita inflata]